MEAESQRKDSEKPNRVERIERHLGSLHDYVRVMDNRIKELEFLNEKQQAIAKAAANAKYRNKPKENKETWQEQEVMVAGHQVAHPLVALHQLAKKRLSVEVSAGSLVQGSVTQGVARKALLKEPSAEVRSEQSPEESSGSPEEPLESPEDMRNVVAKLTREQDSHTEESTESSTAGQEKPSEKPSNTTNS